MARLIDNTPVLLKRKGTTMTDKLLTMPTLGVTELGGEIKMRRTLLPRAGLVPCEIVLCHLPHNAITPWVTWQHNTDEFKSTYWGHYFRDPEEAVTDFFKRGT